MDRESVDSYKVMTPWGEVIAVDFVADRPMPIYRGSEIGVGMLKEHIQRCTGAQGIGLMPNTLEPADLMAFCQSDDSGYLVQEPFDVAVSIALLAREAEASQ